METKRRIGGDGLWWALVGLIVWGITGCSTLTSPDCVGDDDCAQGETCRAGFCVRSGGGTDDVADDAPTDAPAEVDSTDDVTPDADAGLDGTDEVRPSDDVAADTLPDVDVDPAPTSNACGGSTSPLRWEGEAVELGDACGCGGTVVCNGTDAARCAGQEERNVCGGCGTLAGTIGSACDACDGVWVCGASGDAFCRGGARANGCGGCTRMAGAPGRACTSGDATGDGAEAAWVCEGDDAVVCRALASGDNACGGVGALTWAEQPALPGAACDDADLCGAGVLVCTSDRSALTCEGTRRNAAGQCGSLLGIPGEACGCGGEWVIDPARPGGVRCDGGALNACGGCDLLSPAPGSSCGASSVVVCVSAEETVCVARAGERNSCGGTGTLTGVPGAACGACETGRWTCSGANRVTCADDLGVDAFNVCDRTCEPLLGGVLGGACGTCQQGTLVCGGGAALTCDSASAVGNACGGCAPLAGTPGDACGFCAVWECDDADEAVVCRVDPTLPECDGTRRLCEDLAPQCTLLGRRCVEGTGGADAECGDCVDGFVQVDGVCEGPLAAPVDVTASQGSNAAHVTLSWSAVAGASGYHIYRNGVRQTTVAVAATTYNDAGAPAGGPPLAPQGVSGTTNRTTDVRVSWQPAATPDGATARYQVRAVAGARESLLSAEASGYRAAEPVTGYEILVGAGPTWTDVGSVLVWTDATAPVGTVEVATPVATTTRTDGVDLSVGLPTVTPGVAQTYRVRARSGSGTGPESAQGSGQRGVGAPTYSWEWAASSGGVYSELLGATGRTAVDREISPGTSRWYRVRVAAAGATTTTSISVQGSRVSLPVAGVLGERCASDAECPIDAWCPTGTSERRCAPRPTVSGVRLPFQWVPRGAFQMGSPEDELGRTAAREGRVDVIASRDVFVQRTPVTQAQWAAVIGAWNARSDAERRLSGWTGATPTFGVAPSCFKSTTGSSCTADPANPNGPVERVSWWDAVVFANVLSRLSGLEECYTLTGCGTVSGVSGMGGGCSGTATSCTSGTFSCSSVTFAGLDCTGYRLPTEAEWERAARSGTTTASYGGELLGLDCTGSLPSLGSIAWYSCNAESRTRDVETKTANGWGLHDMLGQVWEWTMVWFSNAIEGGIDPVGASTGANRVLRGGTYNSSATFVRAASRFEYAPANRFRTAGFRLVRTASFDPIQCDLLGSVCESQGRSCVPGGEGEPAACGPCLDRFVENDGVCLIRLGAECTGDGQCEVGAWCPTSTTERRCAPRPTPGSAPMEFQWVPRGSFLMGSPATELGRSDDRETQVAVELTRDYFVQRTPVTQGQWAAVVDAWNALPDVERRMSGWSGATPAFGRAPACFQSTSGSSCSTGTNPSGPVERVSWWDVVVFANALSILEGLEPCYFLSGCDSGADVGAVGGGCSGTSTTCNNNNFRCADVTIVGPACTGYRLPTEAEWEWAARAGTTVATYGGELSGTSGCVTLSGAGDFPPGTPLEAIASYVCNSSLRTQPVGSFAPNSWGLFDTLGTVFEWTEGWYNLAHTGGRDPAGASTGTERAGRGGSFSGSSFNARAASRLANDPRGRYRVFGFRLSRAVP